MKSSASLKWQGIIAIASLLAPISLWIFHLNSAVDADSIVMFTAVFFGAVVVGASGFGSAAVGGAIMLFWFVPLSAVPILNAASLTTQTISMGQLWRSLQLRGSVPLIAGGLLGIPLGAWVLRIADPNIFRIVFGAFLLIWSVYLLLRPQLRLRRRGPITEGFVGMTGGFTGGAIAFPGAFPAIWCAVTRATKEEQRGTMQVYILVMQCCVLAYLYSVGMIGRGFLADYLTIFPAIMIGTFIGVALYSRINEAMFRRTVLLILLIASATHIIGGLAHFMGTGLNGIGSG